MREVLPTELAGASPDFLKLNEKQLQQLGPSVPASKYGNVAAVVAGLRFQSGGEAARAGELLLLEKNHRIFGLRFQVDFPIPGGTYRADFVYVELVDGKLYPVVEDKKGYRTKDFIRKRGLFQRTYGQRIRET